MKTDKKRRVVSSDSGKAHGNQDEANPRRELKLLVALFSFATIFFLFGLISFSMQEDKPMNFSVSFTIPHEAFLVLGCIYIAGSLTFLVLLCFTSLAKRWERWSDYSDSKLNKIFWAFFWPLLWMALSITFLAGLIDASNRLPTNWRGITLLVGLFLYLLLSLKIITSGVKRTWISRK